MLAAPHSYPIHINGSRINALRCQSSDGALKANIHLVFHQSFGNGEIVSRDNFRQNSLADHGRMVSFEIVEVNPVIDEHNQTADLAVELSLSAFGKKIL